MVQAENDDVFVHDVKGMAEFPGVADSSDVLHVNLVLAEEGHEHRYAGRVYS